MAVPAPTEPPQPPHLYALESPPPDDGPDPVRTAERAVLGAALTNPRDLDDLTQILNPNDFERPAHELIFAAAIHLHARQKPVDPITISDHLGRDTRRVGGTTYLHELAIAAPIAGSATYHAQIVTHAAARRRATTTAAAIVDMWARARTDEPLTDLHAATLERWEALRHTIPGVDTEATPHTWSPVDLAAIRAAGTDRPRPTIMTTTAGHSLLYRGRTHSISGESTTGKTWITLGALCQQIAQGIPVTYVDFEDRADTLVARLHDMGADPNTVDTLVRYISPERALDAAGWVHVERAVKDCDLVILDGVTEAMTMHGWSLLDNEDIAKWAAALPRRIATIGPAVIEIDHVVKDKEARGRYALGGAHKLNGITGCAYSVLPVRSFAIGEPGSSRIVVAKDRHGGVGPVGHTAAEFHVRPDTSRHREAMTWEISPNQTTFSSTGTKRLTGYMERVSRAIESHDGVNKNGLWSVVKGDKKYVDQALESLIAEGHVRTEDGPNRQVHHYIVSPFREEYDRGSD